VCQRQTTRAGRGAASGLGRALFAGIYRFRPRRAERVRWLAWGRCV